MIPAVEKNSLQPGRVPLAPPVRDRARLDFGGSGSVFGDGQEAVIRRKSATIGHSFVLGNC